MNIYQNQYEFLVIIKIKNFNKLKGVIKVTGKFNSKNMCAGRTYRYILPSFGFSKSVI